ncbi:MAG TPA: anti-sigma factor [Thermoanaerobaculia bacterium]|jgi:anti-sigma-K factor RskA|nr:anti-sigma factor [Thermoanaerobaculia bacterium]
MAHSERHEELVAAVALGMPLAGADRAELEAHLAEGCAVCEGLLADMRDASAALGASVPPAPPPPELRGRILASLGPSRAEAAAPARRAAAVTPSAPASPVIWRVLAAAAALLLAIVVLDDARLRRAREELQSRTAELAARLNTSQTELAQRVLRARVLESEDVQMMMLGGQGPQPGARARVFWSPAARRGVLVASNLAPLPPDRQYELWVFHDGKPYNAGVFDPDPQGRALFESKDFTQPAAQNFAVTVEPRGGVPAPTGPIVLVGKPA